MLFEVVWIDVIGFNLGLRDMVTLIAQPLRNALGVCHRFLGKGEVEVEAQRSYQVSEV